MVKSQFHYLTMPQLLPFYFVSQFVVVLLVLAALTVLISKYFIPYFTSLSLVRSYLSR